MRTDTVRGVAKNAGSLLLAYLLPRGLIFASVVVAARVLGTSDFGEYGTAGSFAIIVSVLSSLGLLPLVVREIAKDRAAAPRLVRSAHVVKGVAGVAMLLLVVLFARVLDFDPEVTRVALTLAAGYWFAALADNLHAYFQGVERMHVCTEASAVLGLVSALAGALLIVSTRDIVWYAAAFPLGHLASLAWLIVRAPADVRRGESPRWADVKRLLVATLPFAAGFALLTVHYKMDLLVLRQTSTPHEAGLYSAAYKFVDFFHALVLVGAGALLPRLTRAARSTGRAYGRWAATRASELVLLAGVPAGGGLWLLRGFVIGMFGPQYADSVSVLAVLALALPALALNLYGGYALIAADRMKAVTVLYALAVVLKLTLELIASARWGAVGVAGAMVAAEVVLAIGFAVALGRLAGAAPGRRALGLAAGAGLLAAAASVLVRPAGAIPAAAVYSVTVIVLYWLGGALTGVERSAIQGAITSRERGRDAEHRVGGAPDAVAAD